jgi:hypothetical protein
VDTLASQVGMDGAIQFFGGDGQFFYFHVVSFVIAR